MTKLSRRKFLYAGAGVAAAAGIGYLTKDYLSPYNESTPTKTATTSPTISESPLPIETTSTTSNPVLAEYGNKLPIKIINRLEPLGYDGINENERQLLEMINKLESNKDIINNKGFNTEQLENILIDVSVENQTVSQDNAIALDFMQKNISDVLYGVINHGFESHFNYIKKYVKREDIGKINPDLVYEMARIPDFTENDEVVDAIFESYEGNKSNFDAMLEYGIKGKRRILTPLEVYAWIFKDRGKGAANSIINSNSLTSFITESWRNTAISQNYESGKWKDVEEVTNRIGIEPSLVEKYMQNNITYYYKGEPYSAKNVEEIFRLKRGACYDHTLFAGYSLKKNGYDAKGLYVNFKSARAQTLGHAVCLYINPKDGKYYTIDVWGWPTPKDTIYGPFDTEKQAAEHTSHGLGLSYWTTGYIDLSGRLIAPGVGVY